MTISVPKESSLPFELGKRTDYSIKHAVEKPMEQVAVVWSHKTGNGKALHFDMSQLQFDSG